MKTPRKPFRVQFEKNTLTACIVANLESRFPNIDLFHISTRSFEAYGCAEVETLAKLCSQGKSSCGMVMF